MCFLPYLDQPTSAHYANEVEKLIQDELKDNNDNEDILHPEVRKQLYTLREVESLYEFYSNYDDTQGWKRKRRETEDVTMNESRKRHKGVDLSRYNVETDNLDSLGLIDSYIRHQFLVLQNMSETLLTQWAINNSYMDAATENLQDRIDLESKQLHDLKTYKESIQYKYGVELKSVKDSWKQQLRRNIEKCVNTS